MNRAYAYFHPQRQHSERDCQAIPLSHHEIRDIFLSHYQRDGANSRFIWRATVLRDDKEIAVVGNSFFSQTRPPLRWWLV